MSRTTPAFFASVSLLVLALTGCTLNSNPASVEPAVSSLSGIQGIVHGGQQPVVGAHVYVLAANASNYAGPGIAASSANASSSLLTAAVSTNSPSNSGQDSLGYYVTTAADGGFALTGDYTCTAGTNVYIYVTGGNTGSGTNSASSLLSVLGTCPAAQDFASTVPYVWVNEVTTAATAFALSGFATDATHIGAGSSTVAQAGLANAFATASSLVNVATGAANSTNGSITYPQATLNTLGNILAACVNSTDTTNTTCTTLFANSLSGGSTGTTPADVASAAINIAHNQGASVSALYGLQAGVSAPFAPNLAAAPADFNLTVSLTSPTTGTIADLAADVFGNIWITSGNATANIARLDPTGISNLNSGATLSTTDANGGVQIAVDTAGVAFINTHGTQISRVVAPSTITGITWGSSSAHGGMIDKSGNYWVSSGNATKVYGFTNGGAALQTISPGSYSLQFTTDNAGRFWLTVFNKNLGYLTGAPGSYTCCTSFVAAGYSGAVRGLQSDANNNIWLIDNETTSKLYGYTTDGTAVGTLSFAPAGIAIDGDNRLFACTSKLTEYTLPSLTALQPGTGWSGMSVSCAGLNIDPSGNVWYGNSTKVYELVGLAAPTAPQSYAAAMAKNGILP